MKSAMTLGGLLLVMGLAAAGGGRVVPGRAVFDHPAHAGLFPLCSACHVGAEEDGAPMWPTAESCAACHDGDTEERVTWSPPSTTRPSNLRFTHQVHARASARPPPGRRAVERCGDCHTPEDADRTTVQSAAASQCLSCHQLTGQHIAVADSSCGTCHRPLASAGGMTEERIGAFPVPPSHSAAGFLTRDRVAGHGALAEAPVRAGDTSRVAASCATCHARDFCSQCHVDAPEQRTIQALAPDRRSLAHAAALAPPTSHSTEGFIAKHGADARRAPASCSTCHTQPSCLSCHVPPGPPSVQRQPRPGPGRAAGASIRRVAPGSHAVPSWTTGHGPEASAAPTRCTTCHVRDSCLACHRPGGADGSAERRTPGGGFHPSGFLTRHPVDAYRRATTCADCHQTAQFCAACHLQSGVTATGTLGTARYHDGQGAFIVGHGPAARRNLESCVSCHVERDCLPCHSALGGRRFSPHGPGFDASRLRRRNPEMCTACHGRDVP